MFSSRMLSFLAALALTACNTPPVSPAGAPPSSTGSGAAAASGASAAPASTVGSPASVAANSVKPRFTRTTGARKSKTLPPIQLKADEQQVQDGAVFLRVAMPADMAGLISRVNGDAVLYVDGDRYGFAVPAAQGRVPDRPLALLRLVGTQVPEKISLTWTTMAEQNGADGVRQRLEVSTAGATVQTTLASRFYRAAGDWFRRHGALGSRRTEPFYIFAGARLDAFGEARRPGGTPETLRRNRRGDVSEAMSLYTGWTSIEEALQADRGLRAIGGGWTNPSIAIDSIKGVALPGHPWDELIAKAGPPIIEPLAAWVPADFFYLHFSDLRQMVRLTEEVDTLITPIIRLLEARPGATRFAKRYERQLALKRSVLSKTFGNQAAKSVAVVASDPFLREGSDVSLLFHIKSQVLLESTLDGYAKAAQRERSDATVKTLQIAGHAVTVLSTPDRQIHRHQVIVDDVLIVSNSARAVARIIAAKSGKTLALSKSGDFRYFRTKYPFNADEMGFAFISDAFVINAISPRAKILQARRVMASAAMAGVNHAMLLHGWLQGAAAPSVKPAMTLGLMAADDLKTPDGEALTWTPALGAASKIWGRPTALTPLIELDVDKATKAEAKAYERFERSYQQYWRGFIDPIGVRLTRRADGGLDLDARMMPLIQRSEYADVERAVGDVRLIVPPASNGLRLTMGVAAQSRLRRELDQLGKQMTQKNNIGLNWLGDWVTVGLGDNGALWDAALSMGNVPVSGDRSAYQDRSAQGRVLVNFPLYVGAHVKDRLALAATLLALKSVVNSVAPGTVKWDANGAHKEVAIVTLEESITGGGIKLHYAITKDAILFSLDRDTLTQLIDQALAGVPVASRTAKQETALEGQAVLDFAPQGNGYLARTILGMLESGNVPANRAAVRAYAALSRGRPGQPITDASALAHLGMVPEHANGGTYRMGDSGIVTHSIYGSEFEPSWPKLPVKGAPITAFLESLTRLRMSMGFEGEGISRGLHTTVRWARRK